MDKKELHKKFYILEKELSLIKEELEHVPKNRILKFLGKTLNVITSNWVILSFIVAIFAALYVKFAYDIDYFEHYRNLSTTKKLSEFYRELGDRMIIYSEWEAAETAYREAVKINKNNLKATFGIVKSQVFQPPEGEKSYTPEVVDSKLDYLKSRFPDDFQVDFLQGVRYWHLGKNDQAKLWFHKSIEKNPKFVGGYLQLGYIYQGTLNLNKAIENYSKCIDVDPNYSMANNNLGFCYMLLGNFENAIKYIEKAYNISPALNIALNAGDAYIYLRDYERARIWHKHALAQISDSTKVDESYLVSEWTANYLPLTPEDEATIKYSVKVFEYNHKKAFLHYSLSFDYALLEEFDSANHEFESGLRLDKNGKFNHYISYKILSIQNFVAPSNKVNRWFDARRKQLVSK